MEAWRGKLIQSFTRDQNAEEKKNEKVMKCLQLLLCLSGGFGHSATSAAELQVRDSTHEHEQRDAEVE